MRKSLDNRNYSNLFASFPRLRQAIPGIDFSDHLNYWKFGFSALMITDTSFYRSRNYHEPTDTVDKLDIQRMAKVIYGVLLALREM